MHLVIPEGFEPSTYCLEGSRSIQLSYGTMVGVAGFEPATSCSQSRRDNRATLHPVLSSRDVTADDIIPSICLSLAITLLVERTNIVFAKENSGLNENGE